MGAQEDKDCFVNKEFLGGFWDGQSILIDYLAKGKTTTENYYAELLDQLKEE